MVKYRLDNFTMLVGDERFISSPPLSLASLLPGGKVPDGVSEAELTTEIVFSEHDLASRYVFLRIYDIPVSSTVRVNGAVIGGSDGIRRDLTLDIRGALRAGKNAISISFAPTPQAGIFGKAELIRTNSAVIDRIILTERQEAGRATLAIKAEMLGAAENVRAVATLVSGAGQIYYGGIHKGRGVINVTQPLYWWPRGLGVQNLYKLTVNLYGENEIEDTVEMRVGLRSIITSKNADGSLLEANGVQFLPMGAVYRHSDSASPAAARKKYEAVITSAARANFNTLIIPLGTPSLPDAFYELCDAHGIVVIHELRGIDSAARELLLRSTTHPSMGLIDLIGVGDGIEETAESIRKLNPEMDFALFDTQPIYPEAASMPTDRTLRERFPDGVNLFSEEMDTLADGKILPMIFDSARDYLYPESTEEFSYTARLSAARKIYTELAEARIARNRRAIFSDIGTDSFIGPSSIDSMARWKSLQYLASRVFMQTFVYAKPTDYAVSFYVSNERRLDFSGEIEYTVRDRENKKIHSVCERCKVNEASVTRLFIRDFSSFIKGFERERYLEYVLREGASIVSRGTLLFTEPKKFRFCDPKIRADISGDDRRFSITLSAEAFASGVELSFSDTDALFQDNLFDVTSAAPIKISFSTVGASTSARHLSETLKIKSIYNMGKDFEK